MNGDCSEAIYRVIGASMYDFAIIGAGVRKIPEPIMRLITIAVDSSKPRSFLYSVTKPAILIL